MPTSRTTRSSAPTGYKGNAALQPERVRGDEFVLELRPSAQSRWTVSAYVNRASNLIAQSVDPADGLLVFNNVGSLRARGVEAEVEYVWQNGVQLRANASVQSVDDSSGQGIDARNAEQLAKLIAVLPRGRAAGRSAPRRCWSAGAASRRATASRT